MAKTVQVHIGETLEASGKRFVDAWHRAERGELHAGNSEVHIGFQSFEGMVRALSPKRLELLRHLHRNPARNVRQLAASLGREYRRVHDDVVALEGAGLLERDGDGLRADYDAFDVRMRVAL